MTWRADWVSFTLLLVSVTSCHTTAPPRPVTESATPTPDAAIVGRAGPDAGAASSKVQASADDIGVRSHAGRTWVSGERVDADVVHVKRLAALIVEANEIRCPHVVRSRSPSVRKELEPLLIAGDLVEVDELEAHAVSARLIIADEIRAVVIRHLSDTHRWAGAGGGAPVRNRVTRTTSRAAGLEVPSF
jgi:hypothetical protein